MRELIVPSKRKLEGDAKALHVSVHPACHSPVQEAHLDRHDRYTSHKGADRQVHSRVLGAVLRNDLDQHVRRERRDK